MMSRLVFVQDRPVLSCSYSMQISTMIPFGGSTASCRFDRLLGVRRDNPPCPFGLIKMQQMNLRDCHTCSKNRRLPYPSRPAVTDGGTAS
ncbi:hypothetical protein M408DRAFT_194141 [Serendipita vermifera MAFF 305830]|uniref:Uncharacterized protein n=1 Tax=Serendipita vermifera MAFF 305830 TaxID=933852 RepID=A0A0C2XAM4_SERVB|nr:hypothetical protein M408DRAFT_194141 [Serendipita vermifera MAFF 305830]